MFLTQTKAELKGCCELSLHVMQSTATAGQPVSQDTF